MNLKNPKNPDSWIAITKYHISPKTYNLHKDFHYLKHNSIVKTKNLQIQFYNEDIITYLQKNKEIITFTQLSDKYTNTLLNMNI